MYITFEKFLAIGWTKDELTKLIEWMNFMKSMDTMARFYTVGPSSIL